MSLNRSEQLICDYVEENPEELRFWREKVKGVVHEENDPHQAAGELAEQLGAYATERAAVVSALDGVVDPATARVPSMRNLAEYWIRLWTATPAKKETDLRRGS